MANEHGKARKSNPVAKQKTRRGGIKHKRKHTRTFSLLGNNSAGLKAKKDSLEAIVNIFKNPSCIALQETKLAKNSNFQLPNYQVFQRNRNSLGGGLLTAVDPSLNPMLIAAKNEEAEILTVQIECANMKLRVINAYGPQDDDSQQNKLNFWMGLEEEVLAAKSESCMVLIQMDANAKVGRNIVSQDPNSITDSNGRHMLELIDRQSLVLLNADRNCVGAVTRYRVTKNGTESAILDYMLVCEVFYQYFEKMIIDEERQYTLTKYATTKGIKRKVESDHNPMYAMFNISYVKSRNSLPRREIFNLKNPECQEKFYEETNTGDQFQKCFSSNFTFENQTNKFVKTLDDVLHKCFKKIRIKPGGQKNEIQDLIEQKTKHSLSLQTVQCKLGRQITENEIQKI